MSMTTQTTRQKTSIKNPVTLPPGNVPTTREGLQALTVVQLKLILKNQGKKVSGRKAELVDRILGVVSPQGRVVPSSQEKPVSNRLSGMVIAVTGTLWMKRDDIQRLIESNGGRFVKTITKAVTHVVAKDPAATTGKLNKAREAGIQVVGEDFLRQLMVPISSIVTSPIITSPIRMPELPHTIPDLVEQQVITTSPTQVFPGSPTGSINYTTYSQPELLTLIQNIYGVRLSGTMSKDEIINWIQMKEAMGQRPPEIIGVGPQGGALSPVITTPIQLPVLSDGSPHITGLVSQIPRMPTIPVGEITQTAEIMGFPSLSTLSHVDQVTVDQVTSPSTSPVQLPPIPIVGVTQSVPTQILSPMASLPPITKVMSPVFSTVEDISSQTTILPPIPPVNIQAVVSPQPMIQLPSTGEVTVPVPIIAGGFDIPTELPTITAPIQTGVTSSISGLETGITMPMIPVVVPTQSIRLPSLEDTGIPQPVSLPQGTLTPTFPPPQPKVGIGGLPIQTDLATLNQLRSEINTAININPQAAFQKKVPAYQIRGAQIGTHTVALKPLPAMLPIAEVTQIVPTMDLCQSLRRQLMNTYNIDETRLDTLTISTVETSVVEIYNQLGAEERNLLNQAIAGWRKQRIDNPNYDPLITCENLILLQAVAPKTLVTQPVISQPIVSIPTATLPTQQLMPIKGLPPLSSIIVSPEGPVQITPPEVTPVAEVVGIQPFQFTQPTGFQSLSPLPQIITSPVPQPAVQLPTQVQLPTTREKPTQKIHLPKIKATAPLPVTQVPTKISGLPQIRLPTITTVMQPIILTSPMAVSQQRQTGLAVAYTPEQQVVENIMKIDPKRLNPRRARRDDNSYTVAQLRAIAGSINLPKSGNKKELVDRIKAQILKVNPDAFNQ